MTGWQVWLSQPDRHFSQPTLKPLPGGPQENKSLSDDYWLQPGKPSPIPVPMTEDKLKHLHYIMTVLLRWSGLFIYLLLNSTRFVLKSVLTIPLNRKKGDTKQWYLHVHIALRIIIQNNRWVCCSLFVVNHHSNYGTVQHHSSFDIYHSIRLTISCIFNNSPRMDLAYYAWQLPVWLKWWSKAD